MKLIACTERQHASAILTSTALYDYKTRHIDSMTSWFVSKLTNNFPVIGLEDEQGTLLGFARYGTFRAWPAYKYSVEHSIYIHKDHHGKGLGEMLLNALIDAARERDVHTLIGAIDATNSSIALHEKNGFSHTGTIKQAAYKFDHWLDLAFYQLILNTPSKPVGG